MKKLISAAVAIFVSVSLMAQTSADLKLNLAKNKTYRVASTMKQNTSVTYGGASQQVETTSKTTLSVTPFTVTADFIEADVRFDTIITNSSMPKLDISSLKKGSLS